MKEKFYVVIFGEVVFESESLPDCWDFAIRKEYAEWGCWAHDWKLLPGVNIV